MSTPTAVPAAHASLRRWRVVLPAALAWALLLKITFVTPIWEMALRTSAVALAAWGVFELLARWPARLPGWAARWAVQVLGVAAAMPAGTLAVYLMLAALGVPPFWVDTSAFSGLMVMSVSGLLFAPWVAMAALMRQRDAAIVAQARAFERERGELARAATEARLALLQAQVQPHFLFNTLANVRELVASGSPRAPEMLDSLIAYLRAAVPRLDGPEASLGEELLRVRAYLDLMHLRMPDRLACSVEAVPGSHALRCPPLALLTLVENAVRHGIDPSETGGRIDVRVHTFDGRVRAEVADTGIGLGSAGQTQGTGLALLRERLHLAYGPSATLSVSAQRPQGVVAAIEFPAERAAS